MLKKRGKIRDLIAKRIRSILGITDFPGFSELEVSNIKDMSNFGSMSKFQSPAGVYSEDEREVSEIKLRPTLINKLNKEVDLTTRQTHLRKTNNFSKTPTMISKLLN